MRIADQIVLGALAGLLVFLSIMFAWTAIGTAPLWHWLDNLQQSPLDAVLLMIILAGLAVYLGLILRRQPASTQSLVHSTDFGQVRISFSVIKALVARAAQSVEGIKDVSVRVDGENTLRIHLRVRLLPDYHIPSLVEAVQRSVQAYVLETIGMEMDSIEVEVMGTLDQGGSRVH